MDAPRHFLCAKPLLIPHGGLLLHPHSKSWPKLIIPFTAPSFSSLLCLSHTATHVLYLLPHATPRRLPSCVLFIPLFLSSYLPHSFLPTDFSHHAASSFSPSLPLSISPPLSLPFSCCVITCIVCMIF